MLGPFATASRLTPTHQVSLPVLSDATCALMSTTTTTTRDRGDRYGPMEWAQQCHQKVSTVTVSTARIIGMHTLFSRICPVWFLGPLESVLDATKWHFARLTHMTNTETDRELNARKISCTAGNAGLQLVQ